MTHGNQGLNGFSTMHFPPWTAWVDPTLETKIMAPGIIEQFWKLKMWGFDVTYPARKLRWQWNIHHFWRGCIHLQNFSNGCVFHCHVSFFWLGIFLFWSFNPSGPIYSELFAKLNFSGILWWNHVESRIQSTTMEPDSANDKPINVRGFTYSIYFQK